MRKQIILDHLIDLSIYSNLNMMCVKIQPKRDVSENLSRTENHKPRLREKGMNHNGKISLSDRESMQIWISRGKKVS